MSRWRVLIADDEPAARRGVRQLLEPFEEFRVVAECRTGLEVLNALDTARPDLVFLDIQMPDLNGFEVIQQRTPDRMPLLIFLTAYETYALEAFEAHAFDYLVKPVAEARFARAMRRARDLLSQRAPASTIATMAVNVAHGTTWLAVAEVDWIEARGNYARVWSRGRGHLVRQSLNALETDFGPHGFVRAHRNALVRIGAVRTVTQRGNDGRVAILTSGTRVPISRRRQHAFLAAIRRIGPLAREPRAVDL